MRAALVLLAACAAPTTGQGAHAIIGGALDPGDPAVAYVVIAGAPCSGVLVAPRVVITAAHCATGGDSGTVSFGASTGAFTETIAIEGVWRSRYWTAGDDTHDLAALHLASPASATPVLYDGAPPVLDGLTVRAVGFGRTIAGDPASAGDKRSVTLHAVGGALAGDASASTCTGDSGGAVLADIGAGERLVAIVTAGAPDCAGSTYVTRLGDVPFLSEVIAAWVGCPTPSDCGPCPLDGTCTPDCPAIDLDCPLGAAIGVDCGASTTCESRLCTTAPDDPAVHYCSASCAVDADCPAPLGACALGRCVFANGTPGILGAPCDDAAACRSGLCDTRQHICAVPCADGDACPDGFACGPIPGGRACTLPDRGCSAGGSPGPLLLVLAVVVPRRRRRRRPAA